MERKFSLYDIEQFMREAGAMKITEDAVVDMERELSELAEKITEEALGYARHAGRSKLIRRSDIMLLRQRARRKIRIAKLASKSTVRGQMVSKSSKRI